jgi:hypothetical protein
MNIQPLRLFFGNCFEMREDYLEGLQTILKEMVDSE